jgi:UDP-N-acetyl-D-glucosamine dehydrogenase
MKTFLSNKETLLAKIRNKSAVVGVIGLGYVGLPLAVEIAKTGYSVIGVEQNPIRASKVNQGVSYIGDVNPQELATLAKQGKIQALQDFSKVHEMDVVVIAVPTPLTKNLVPVLRYVKNVTNEIAKNLREGQLVSLESTTYPGTTEEVLLPMLESSGLVAEKDFFLAYSPERVDPGNKQYTTKNITKIVGGIGPESLDVALAFYSQIIEKVVPVSSAKTAEMVKVFENTFRSVNIALVNELTMLCDKIGLNVWEVLEAAFTKPFGILPFYPGPGVGGHCIPLDPHYLEWMAKGVNFHAHFISLAGEINRKMPEFVREKTIRILNELGIPLSKAKLLILGAAYKKNIGDIRESPALRIIELLLKDKAKVIYHDPYVPALQFSGIEMQSVPLSPKLVKEQDLVLIATDHDNVNYKMVFENACHVFDTRNVSKKFSHQAKRVTLL